MFKRPLFLLSLLILCVFFVSVTWAQKKDDWGFTRLRESLVQRALGSIPKSIDKSIVQKFSAQVNQAQTITVYDLGFYPGGTWSQLSDINKDGMAVGVGDNASGESRPIGVPLFDPKGFVWFDLGTFSKQTTVIGGSCSEISDRGMIVGSAATEQGYRHAFVWTPGPGAKKVDLGTWKQDGFDTYDTDSQANGVNKLGTLIVGTSSLAGPGGTQVGMMTAVVWTPTVVQVKGKTTIVWNINKLETGGLEKPGKVVAGVTLSYWIAITVNDDGQIIGDAWDGIANVFPVIWNPIPGGKGWKVMLLPIPADTNAEVYDINNLGEVVGSLYAQTDAPAMLWKPFQSSRRTYTMSVLPHLYTDPGYPSTFNMATGINDLGDIVGGGFNEFWNFVAAQWSSKDLSFVQVLGFPGVQGWGSTDWSQATKVNNLGIAAGTYGHETSMDNPRSDPHAVAVKFK